MKFARIAVCLSLSVSLGVSTASAAENLFSISGNRAQIAAPGELLRIAAQDPANERIEIVSARANLISSTTREMKLSLPGSIEVSARQSSFERMESGNEVWIGRIDMGHGKAPAFSRGTPLDAELDHIIAVRSGDTVMANIRVAGELYRLIPIDKGAHALIEVDQSKFLVDEDDQAYAEMLRNSPQGKSYSEARAPVAKAISTIRVLVAFGSAATSAVGNEQQATDLAFAEANQALSATNTEIRFQQAGAIQFYTQSETTNYSTMLSRLTNGADGFYDAIQGQRNSNTADMVAYIAPSSSTLCGQAAGIATSSSNAYFVMNYTCLSGNYTFVHEAAHVVGARHDNDPTTSPYAYGHGYVMPSISRRTVMAVNNGPCPSCTRVGAFSSPNYTLSGVTIGTASTNDNNRVWRTRGPTVAGFR